MMRYRWPIYLVFVLLAAAPMQGAGPRDPRREDVVPRATQQAAAAVRPGAKFRQAEPARATSIFKQPTGTPTGIIPPGGTPPVGDPSDEDAADQTAPPTALEDTHRDYTGQLPVFPGAEGFGSTTPAGRGGRVLRVTTLADSGPGSFRQAVAADGPRTVVFEVGGVINLKSRIEITEPFLTIAGQTAPSPGITLARDMLRFETHDVLIQHLRIRPGDRLSETNTPPVIRDSLGIATNSTGDPHTYNIVIDHCSISWGIDENLSLWYPNVYDVTVSNSIISEGLKDSLHPDGYHAMGMIVGHGQRRIAVVRNLFAHNQGRNPMFTGDSTGLIANNVIYNVVYRAIDVGIGSGPGPVLLSVMGNTYLPGRDSNSSVHTIMVRNTDPATRLYVADNIGPHATDDPWSAVDNRAGSHVRAESPPVGVTPLTVLPAERAFAHVLRNAGARPAERDAVDRRVVQDVELGTGRLIDRPSDVGGLGSMPSSRRRLSPPANPMVDGDDDGYTDVEEWLHCMADRVESAAAQFSGARDCR